MAVNPDTGLLEQPAAGTVEPAKTVLPSDEISSQAEASTYEAERRQIDTEKDTVAGQLEGVLSSDSDYIKRAEFKGQEYANSRGLLNSSIAAGASTGAAIDAALPIAQQDADSSLRQGLENQAAANTAASTNAQLQTQVASDNAARVADMEKTQFSELAATGRQNIIAQTELQTTNAKIAAEKFLNDQKVDAADRETFSQSYSEMSRQNDLEVTKIAVDPALSETEKNRLITAQNDRYTSNIQLLADLYSIPITLNENLSVVDSNPETDTGLLFDQPETRTTWPDGSVKTPQEVAEYDQKVADEAATEAARQAARDDNYYGGS